VGFLIKLSYAFLIIGLDSGFNYKTGRVKYTDVSHVSKTWWYHKQDQWICIFLQQFVYPKAEAAVGYLFIEIIRLD
jgi:hypothetical protein